MLPPWSGRRIPGRVSRIVRPSALWPTGRTKPRRFSSQAALADLSLTFQRSAPRCSNLGRWCTSVPSPSACFPIKTIRHHHLVSSVLNNGYGPWRIYGEVRGRAHTAAASNASNPRSNTSRSRLRTMNTSLDRLGSPAGHAASNVGAWNKCCIPLITTGRS
jgi:hypothetical protein